jgi:transposase
MFRMATCALYRSQTELGGFLRRMEAKLGVPKAITATARKIAAAQLVYQLIPSIPGEGARL